MLKLLILKFVLSLVVLTNCLSNDEQAAEKLVEKICDELKTKMYETNVASWNHATNLTNDNEKKKEDAELKMAKYNKKAALELLKFDYKNFKNETLKRLMSKMTMIGDNILDEKDFRELSSAISQMQSNFAKFKIGCFKNKNELLEFEPDIIEILLKSRDPDELEYYWTNFYNLAGTPSVKNFYKYVELRNKAAVKNKFKDGSEMWLSNYEDENFEKNIEEILEQIKPFYMQLHAFVRHKLHEHYGPEHVDLKKPIPMHLLGNMWGQLWEIDDLIVPYQNASKIEFTEELVKQGYTAKKMFETAEEFFKSINLSPMPELFWKNSVIEKPKDREIVCHASAWDFTINDDVRIKMCTKVTMGDFVIIHHEMGHIEYHLQYKNLPLPFRNGANEGFHEAVGDTIALSVSSPKHLNRIGLLKSKGDEGQESNINQLMSNALRKLALLPFAYVMDKFRYEVFRGTIEPENANCHFWRLREKHGGIAPASVRGNHDFDITAKYHVSADVEYMRYFVANIIQFQFHKAACIKAGEYESDSKNPTKSLNNCDIYQSKEAGNALKEMLSLGASKHWSDVLETLTGERKLDASAFLEYFQPLQDWLIKTNEELGVNIGWELSDKIDCPNLYE
ncbi:hypothetical protein PVAND_006849 [Polypedilum vanderplanki]|uniref:Angiotensin-converting enzyme n=1 Tax=Polypedilum vanderplanki TaxID=319348 RepID=A0A9J6C4J3_POLVA|nr:hypothetical protein PVAND_006849 [Polypedilum vanderplanki]